MKHYVIMILLVVAFTSGSKAQLFNAGPDRDICSGTGTFLGVQGQMIPSSWCIHWEPEESLDDPSSARPKATPKSTTVYTVTVLTDDWQSVNTDQVTVTVAFGGLKFTPPFLTQGSEETSQSEVTINPGNDEVTWSIEGEALGCTINSMSGEITPGNEYGKIKVRATKVEDPECFAEENIDVNEGTKDVTARDFNTPGRIAKDGTDTLYVIGEGGALITAVPNATGFSAGNPMWYNDGNSTTVSPPNGQSEYFNNPVTADGEWQFIAGSQAAGYEPKVVVIGYDSDELTIDISPLVNEFTDKIDKVNKFLTEKIKKKFPAIPGFSLEVNLAALKYKKSKAEKYNDPGWDYKYTFEAGGSLALSGKVYHPGFTYIWDLQELFGLTLGTELYIEPYFEVTLTGLVTKDPALADASWTFIGPNIKFSVQGGVRGVFNAVGTGFGYSIEGGGLLGAELQGDLTFNLDNGELRLKWTLSPLQINTKLLVERFVDPKKKWKFFDYTVDLVDKIISPNFLLKDFD